MKTNILLIILAVFVLYFTKAEFEYLFLFIPSVLLLSYHLCELVLKVKNSKRSKKIKENKYIEHVFYIGILSIFFSASTYENTIGGFELFWKFSYLSILVTLLVVLILNQFYIMDEGSKNILSVCICFSFLIPNTAVLVNRYNYYKPEVKNEMAVNYKEISKSNKGGISSYQLFITTKYDSNERIEVRKEVFDVVDKGKIVVLTSRRGIMGYHYITQVEAK